MKREKALMNKRATEIHKFYSKLFNKSENRCMKNFFSKINSDDPVSPNIAAFLNFLQKLQNTKMLIS